MLVQPPATAAAAPVAIVSLYSCPGSRRCVCKSMKPGATIRPVASSTCASSGIASDRPSKSTMRPSSINTFLPALTCCAGSITYPFAISVFIRVSVSSVLSVAFFGMTAAREEIQNGHPHRNAVCHLVQDQRSEEHTSELQSQFHLVCRLLLEKKN